METSSSSVRCTVDCNGTVHGNADGKWWCVFDQQSPLPCRGDSAKAKSKDVVRNTYVCKPGALWPSTIAREVHKVCWDKAFQTVK